MTLPRIFTPWRSGAHKNHVLELHPRDRVFCRQCARYLDQDEAETAWPHEEEPVVR